MSEGPEITKQMNAARALDLLRRAFDLCGQALDGETDRATVEAITFAREQLCAAIGLLEQDGPDIPLMV